MTQENFNKIVEEETDRIKSVLVKKQAEYNLDEDRLSHFKRAAVFAQESPEKVLFGYLLKHLMSVSDMVSSDEAYSEAVWHEKMTDIHNYLILLYALLKDTDSFKTDTAKTIKYSGQLNETAKKKSK